MAFMMPVMKKDFDIYGSRSRKTSECSSGCNSRKVSETRSECPSLSTSPGNDYISSAHRHHLQRSLSAKPFSRTSSRTSQNSFITSPTRSSLPTGSPPRSVTARSKSTSNNNNNNNNGSQNSLNNKSSGGFFDKMFRPFRKDNSTNARS